MGDMASLREIVKTFVYTGGFPLIFGVDDASS
jgi:hypothetical protein